MVAIFSARSLPPRDRASLAVFIFFVEKWRGIGQGLIGFDWVIHVVDGVGVLGLEWG
jgi:hypothetical protein